MYEVEERNPQVSVRRKRVSKGRKDIRRKRRIAKRMMNITFLSLAKENRKGTMSENGGTPYSTYSICSDSSKYYKTIVVRPGESLWSIAETYCTDDCRTLTDYIGVLKELNHLKGDTIYAGERILVVCQNYGD